MTSEAVGGTPLSVYVDQHRKVEGGPATPVYITNLAGAGPDPTGATDGFVWTADGVGGAGWEGVPGAVTPDVDDLTTTTGVANDMLRVGAGGGLVYRTPAETLGDIGAEPALGNPGTSGYLLSSTDGGVRSWVAPASGGLLAVNNLSDLTNTTTARDNLGVEIGADVQAYDAGLADIAALAVTDGNIIVGNGANWVAESGATARVSLGIQDNIIIACSNETTALTTGTAKVTFRMPYAMTLTAVRASVTTAPTGSLLQVDINEGGTSILSTKLTIDATEKTSTTAATPAVISDSALADDAEITIDIDAIGSTVAGAGLKVTLIGNKA